jgi:hypothetical protein
MDHSLRRISVTTTVAQQTHQQRFGDVLVRAIGGAGRLAGTTLAGAIPGLPILSAAVSSVSSLSALAPRETGGIESRAGAVPVASHLSTETLSSAGQGLPMQGPGGSFDALMCSMRQEADRSISVQLQLQQENREYNTLTNVLKVRHDSAKSAINNLR